MNLKKKTGRQKKGQVWVETVIYTLIAFSMIGLILAFAQPKIQQTRDKAIIEQSSKVLEDLNRLILTVDQGGPGNKRLIEIGVKAGKFEINSEKDVIIYELDGKYQFSEPGKEIKTGGLRVFTEEQGKTYLVRLTLGYSALYNITFESKEEIKTLNKAPTPYKIIVTNRGGDRVNIDFVLG